METNKALIAFAERARKLDIAHGIDFHRASEMLQNEKQSACGIGQQLAGYSQPYQQYQNSGMQNNQLGNLFELGQSSNFRGGYFDQ